MLNIEAALNVRIKAKGLVVTKETSFHFMPWREEIYATDRTFISNTPFDKIAYNSY
jgi:hypothetical protein